VNHRRLNPKELPMFKSNNITADDETRPKSDIRTEQARSTLKFISQKNRSKSRQRVNKLLTDLSANKPLSKVILSRLNWKSASSSFSRMHNALITKQRRLINCPREYISLAAEGSRNLIHGDPDVAI